MPNNLFDLTNKVALITGSSKGIGRAIAEEMARQGAKVVISSRKADVCQKVADGINAEAKATGSSSGEAIVIPAHVGQREALQRLVNETRTRLGAIDILVCNAAVNPFYGSMQELPDDALDKILDINIKSNHWLVNMVLPEMIERKDGSIIIVSSVGGLRGSPVPTVSPRQQTYSWSATWWSRTVDTMSASMPSHRVWCVPTLPERCGKTQIFSSSALLAIRSSVLVSREKSPVLRCIWRRLRALLPRDRILWSMVARRSVSLAPL